MLLSRENGGDIRLSNRSSQPSHCQEGRDFRQEELLRGSESTMNGLLHPSPPILPLRCQRALLFESWDPVLHLFSLGMGKWRGVEGREEEDSYEREVES